MVDRNKVIVGFLRFFLVSLMLSVTLGAMPSLVYAASIPTVTTIGVTNVTETSATINGYVSDDGGSNIVERRFSWGVTPSCSDGWTNSVTVYNGGFSYVLTGLNPGTTYYYQTWAKNSAGWGQGSALSFTTTAQANQAPTCSLSANPTSGNAPLAVTFTLSASDSDGSITAWVLDVNGDGNADYSGTGNPPATRSYTYTAAGSYSVAFMVSDNQGANAVATRTVNVDSANQPPTCSLIASPNSGNAPLSVTFTLSANDPEGALSTWVLDANGDGTTDYSGSGTPPSTRSFTFNNPGTYTAVLMVSDSSGTSASAVQTITVSSQSQIPAVETRTATGISSTAVTLNGAVTSDGGSSIVERRFDWGTTSSCSDGSTASVTISGSYFSYNLTGLTAGTTYYFRVRARNSAGWGQGSVLSFTTTAQVNQLPTCSVSANPRSGNAPLNVTFTMSASDPDGSITAWLLDVNGDGSADYQGAGSPPSTLNHSYATPGSYSVVLVVGDNGGASATATETVNVGSTIQSPICSLSASHRSGNAPFTVTFTITANDPDGSISNWVLRPGDGSSDYSGSGNPPSTKSHTYSNPGTYNVILIVTDNNGATGSATETISVTPPSTALSFTALTPSTITTDKSSYTANLSASGANFNNVNRVTFSWSGPDSDSETWTKGSSDWNAGVTVNSDSSMTLRPRVLYNESGTQTKTWTWTVTLRDSTGATASQTFTVTYEQAALTLTLYVHEGSDSGPVIAGARVTGQDADGTSFEETTNASGYVTITGAPGTWSFTASKSGYDTNSWSQSITSTCTKHAHLTTEQETLAQIHILKVTPDSNLQPGTETAFTVEVEYSFSNMDGAILYVGFNNVVIDEYRVYGQQIVRENEGVYTFEVTVETKDWGAEGDFVAFANISEYPHSSEWSPLDSDVYPLSFGKNVTLTLYVHEGSDSGPVIAGARVTGQDADGTSFEETTNASGYVTITGAPGTWSFTASKSGYDTNSWSQSITSTTTKHAYLYLIEQESAQPAMHSSPAGLSFTAVEGQAIPSSQTLNIWNSGTGTLEWRVSDDAAWLSLSQSSGSSTGETDAVKVSVDTSGMSAGSYNGNITISSPSGSISSRVVPVTLTISPQPVTNVLPDLTVTLVDTNSEGVVGQKLSVTFVIENLGEGESGLFHSVVALSPKSKPWGTEIYLGDITTGSISPGNQERVTTYVTVPPSVSTPGDYYVTVYADAFERVRESNEDNNIGSTYPETIVVTSETTTIADLIASISTDRVPITVDGELYFIVTLENRIDPLTLEVVTDSGATKVYVDAQNYPISDEKVVSKISLIDRAQRWVETAGSKSAIYQNLDNIESATEAYESLVFWGLASGALAKGIAALITTGKSIAIEVTQTLIDYIVSCSTDPQRVIEWYAYGSFSIAEEEYRQVLELIESGPIADWSDAKAYFQHLFAGYANDYPAIKLLLQTEEISKDWLDDLADLINSLGQELIPGGSLLTLLQNLHGHVEQIPCVARYFEERNSWLKNGEAIISESLLSGAAAAYTLELAGTPRITSGAHSPVEIRVYDSQGRVTGIVNGEEVNEIPYSVYYENTVTVFSPNDSYRLEISGTDDGSYALSVTKVAGDEVSEFSTTDIPVSLEATHQLAIDWDAFAQGESKLAIQVDSDGDGIFEEENTVYLLAMGSEGGLPTWAFIIVVLACAFLVAAFAILSRVPLKTGSKRHNSRIKKVKGRKKITKKQK